MTQRLTRVSPVALRYLLFQLPGWGFAWLGLYVAWRWWGLSSTLAVSLFGLLLLKDLVVYPFVRDAYSERPSSMVGPERLIGAVAVTGEEIGTTGYLRIRGELWRAEAPPGTSIGPGVRVRVRQVRGLTAQIEALDDPPSPAR